MRIAAGILALVATSLITSSAPAQIVSVQGIYVPGRDGRPASTGVQGELGSVFLTRNFDVWTSAAVEYQRQNGLGPGRGRISLDLRLLAPSRDRSIDPYIGGSFSANRSGGANPEWEGTFPGIAGIAGVLMTPSNTIPIAILLEERFGYVRTQAHYTATHLGVAVRFF